jgi:6,7-dimethyl-8-ribityllumazine synthase
MKIQQGELVSQPQFKIGVVMSRFNIEITEKLEKGALSKLLDLGVAEKNIVAVRVPGAVEIPLAAKLLFEQGCHAVVALGAVIRGETAHFDYVCNSVERGCTQLQLEFGRPVGFGVITTENEDQAYARAGGSMGNKGAESAEVVIEMLNLTQKLTQTT